MAGEAEVDEPLAVEPAGHLFQDLDAPLAILDQVVVGGEDGGDAALDGKGGPQYGNSMNVVPVERRVRRSGIKPFEAQRLEIIIRKFWVVSMKVLDPKRRVVGPIVGFGVKDGPKRALAADNDPGTIDLKPLISRLGSRRGNDPIGTITLFGFRYIKASLECKNIAK
jgi:hypothetical protein